MAFSGDLDDEPIETLQRTVPFDRSDRGVGVGVGPGLSGARGAEANAGALDGGVHSGPSSNCKGGRISAVACSIIGSLNDRLQASA